MSEMQKLNLPENPIRMRKEGREIEIFDSCRKKFLKCTPEEWVRQNFIEFLVNLKRYPRGLLAVEKEIKVHGLKRRPDLVVFRNDGKALLIAEFKAPSVKIDEEVFFQAAMYCKKIMVPYLILSNGLQHYCAKIDSSTGLVDYLEDIPDFNDL